MVIEVVFAEAAERDLREVDRVLGPLRMGHRAHEGLVAVPDVRIDHIEVALVDRHVDRLADGAAGVVQVGAHVRELHEVLEVLDRSVAPAVVEVADERRAVVRGEDRVRIADLDAPFGVSGVLGEDSGRACPDDLAAHPAGEPHAIAVDIRAAEPHRLPCRRIATEVDPDFLKNRVSVPLERRQALLVQDLVRLELAGEERDVLGVRGETGGAPGIAAAAGAMAWALDGHRLHPPSLGHRSAPMIPTSQQRPWYETGLGRTGARSIEKFILA